MSTSSELPGSISFLNAVERRHQQSREGEVGVAARVGATELDPLRLRRRRVHRDPHRRAPVALRVHQVHRRLEARHEPLVAVRRRVREGEQRRRVLEQAADGVHRHVGQAGVAVAREERHSVLPEGKVRVHAAAVVLEQGLRHEGDRLAVAGGSVLDDVLVEHHRVRHLDEGREPQVDLGLTAGADLVVLALGVETELLHREDHLAPHVLVLVGRRHREVALLVPRLVAEVRTFVGAAVPAALDRVDLVEAEVRTAVETHVVEDEELGLRAEEGGVRQTRRLHVGLGRPGDAARVAAVALPRDRIDDVAGHDERLVLEVRVDERRVRVGDHQHVRLVDHLPAADARAVEAEPVLEGALVDLAGRHREVLPQAGKVGEPEIDDLDPLIADPIENRLGACS